MPHSVSNSSDHSPDVNNGTPAQRRPIAICGMAMRLPGGIHDEEAFWDVLVKGKDMRMPIPADRYNAGAFDKSLGKKGAIETQYGYFLKDDLSHFDASFFSMTESDVQKTDPQQRKILEVTRECLESAGEVDFAGKDIGCYVGTFGEDWLHSQSKENQFSGSFAGSGDLMLANRVSYEFDFKGPSLVIKTGCSASLVGLHHACRALQNGDCSSAIVAGSSLIMGPYLTAAMTQQGVLSPDGSCKTFDASANGFARADSINAIYIKPLEDAIRDGNPIRAVIRGALTNSDGKSASLMAPSGDAHERMMRKVYADSGLDPAETAFVECHGTGTATGDPIETNAVGKVFGGGTDGILIGSVKPNVGHAEGASGLNSLIKAVLILERGTIPPQIKFDNPNPKIAFKELGLQVPTKPTTWPTGRAERVSVNSFGIGGTNSHVILDSVKQACPEHYTQLAQHAASQKAKGQHARPMLVSANTPESLKNQIANVKEYLTAHPDRTDDLAYTLALRREHLPHRGYFIAKADSVQGSTVSTAKIPSKSSPLTMVFSGQGAQWPGMARELIEKDSEFLTDVRELNDVLEGLQVPPSWNLEEELLKPADSSNLSRAEFAQPLTTAVQICLFNSLTRAGVEPTAVVGHSSGEIAAAYAAGAFDASTAIMLAYYRGLAAKQQHLLGGMAAIGMSAGDVQRFLVDGVSVACENSPSSTTIAGDLDKLQQVVASIKEQQPDVLARTLKVDMAYHSHHMTEISKKYVQLISAELQSQGAEFGEMHVSLYSSVLRDVIHDSNLLGAEYWALNLTSPVRFSPAVSKLLSDRPQTTFVEIGPHSTLAGPLREISAELRLPLSYVSTMIRSKDCTESLLDAYGQLFTKGCKLNLAAFIPDGRTLHDFPAYPWDHSVSFWSETRVSKQWRFREFGHHATLGQRIPESTTFAPSWRVVIDLEDEPWLIDHKVRDDIVYPFAAYVSMAGEAVRQLSGIEKGYSVRHVVASTALVLSQSKPVEVVTSLRRHKLTDTNESEGYDFIISSWSGSAWITHCEGFVKPLEEAIHARDAPKDLDRKTTAARWYDVMARVGLNYGAEFQGIRSLSSSATEKIAVGTVSGTPSQLSQPFVLHPATIDSCLQMILAAQAQVAGRNLTQLCVPTLIEELDIAHGSLDMQAHAWVLGDGTDVGMDCIADGKLAMRLRGARLTPLEDENSISNTDTHAGARLQWYPDIDFLELGSLFDAPAAGVESKRTLEELALLCLLDSAERVQDIAATKPHFDKFRQWLAREKARAETNVYPCIDNASDYVKLTAAERDSEIKERMSRFDDNPNLKSVALGILRIRDNAEGLFSGDVDTLELLMKDNVLTEIYDGISFGFGRYVHSLATSKPNLRILEVGAGTGGTTELILRALERSGGGNPAYSSYMFTDISAGFFAQAQERFSYAPNMEYKVFDISMDAAEQGFEMGSYDLILAPNVVHATPSLYETLSVLQPLLKDDGHLVLSEVCAQARAPGYVFGNFSGWWLGEADNRKWEPYIMVDRWDTELKNAGYTGVEAAVYDGEVPFEYCAAIVSQPQRKRALSTVAASKDIALLCQDPDHRIAKSLQQQLVQSGYTVTPTRIGDDIPGSRHVISTLDLESPFFENIGEAEFKSFQHLLRHHGKQTMLWLLPPTQLDCEDPRCAQTIGMFRVARAELAVPFHTLEIRVDEPSFSTLVEKVFAKVVAREDTEKLLPDREYAVQNGVIKIGRYQPFNVRDEIAARSVAVTEAEQSKTLEIGKPGLLNTLYWTESPLKSELAEHEVEVENRAVGLNFRDIMVAMGVLAFGGEGRSVPLGIEVTGVVTRVGSQVADVKAGDRVIAIAADGCFATRALFKDDVVVKMPDSLGFEEGATMPACYTTALQALIDVGGLSDGQTVLIHSACGGVGHAAIELAKMVGATIYCTAGSEEKRKYLTEKLGIPAHHVFNSRDTSFVDGVMGATGGVGVDIVLNSLSGDMLHASWKCVAEFGKLVELGKRDLVGYGKLEMEPFLANRSYCCVDLAHSIRKRPATVGAVMKRWVQMLTEGHLHPIPTTALFDVAEIEKAFRYLQKGDHIGKAVVRMPSGANDISSSPRSNIYSLSPDASYLLTGGLGGVGRSMASWMVEHGARSLIFLSPRAGTAPGDQEFFHELNSMGCEAVAVRGKADDLAAVKDCIEKARLPIKGVIHLAMRLRDGPVLDLTHEEWCGAIDPKVKGALNIHEAFLDQAPLDFFVMTSSLVAMVDQPGQANYAAGNTFMESFCQWRHKQGLAASVMALCPIDDIGFVAEIPQLRRKLKVQGLYFLPEREVLDFVELAILNSPAPKHASPVVAQDPWKSEPFIVMGLRYEGRLDDPSCQVSWRRDRRMGQYHNGSGDTSTSANKEIGPSALGALLSRAAADPAMLHDTENLETMALEIGIRIFRFMMRPIEDVEIGMSLAQIGLDSLMAIELRRWWKQAFGMDISILEIMNCGTLLDLARFAADGVKAKLEAL